MSQSTSCTTPSAPHTCVNCVKRTLSLFEGLSTKELELLNKNRVVVNFKRGETIYKENCKPSGLYCLNTGKAKLVKYATNGNEVIVALKKPVDFLDIESIVTGRNYTHTAIALEDASVCIIDEQHFKHILMHNIQFAQKLIQVLATVVLENNEQYISITQKQIQARIADVLLKIQEFYGTNSEGYIDVALKRQDIAALSGMTTANVIRTISALKKQKIIKCYKKWIKLIDMEALRQISLQKTS